ERRGIYKNMTYLDTTRVEFDWEFPLGEIILDFFDRLKTISRGYASLDYEFLEYRTSDLVKLDMLINGDPVDAFSVIIHRDKAYDWGRKIADKLKELIPTPLIAALSEQTTVDILVTPRSAPLLANNPALGDVIVYDKRDDDRGIRGFVRMARKLRANRYAAAYLAQGSVRSGALALAAGIPTRTGFATSAGRRFYTVHVPHFENE